MVKPRLFMNTSPGFLLLSSIDIKSLHQTAMKVSHFCTYLIVGDISLCPPATDSTWQSAGGSPVSRALRDLRKWEDPSLGQMDPGMCLPPGLGHQLPMNPPGNRVVLEW